MPARAAALILDAFLDYNARFSDITRRAQRWFERRNWNQAQIDVVWRLDLYDECLIETLGRLRAVEALPAIVACDQNPALKKAVLEAAGSIGGFGAIDLLASRLAQRVDLEPGWSAIPAPVGMVTSHPEGGVPVTVTGRR